VKKETFALFVFVVIAAQERNEYQRDRQRRDPLKKPKPVSHTRALLLPYRSAFLPLLRFMCLNTSGLNTASKSSMYPSRLA